MTSAKTIGKCLRDCYWNGCKIVAEWSESGLRVVLPYHRIPLHKHKTSLFNRVVSPGIQHDPLFAGRLRQKKTASDFKSGTVYDRIPYEN